MLVGASQIDITPVPGIELQGFAIREQPSQSVGDRLYVRTLYLNNGENVLLGLVFDLIGFSVPFADSLRTTLAQETGLSLDTIFVTTAHTHSGPGTSQLSCCGAPAPEFMQTLLPLSVAAAQEAIHSAELCRVLFRETLCDLALDRTQSSNPHVDSRTPMLAWQKENGNFKALMLSYNMHPVCLGGTMISADWTGYVSRKLGESFPGSPITLVLSGACGNLNPPMVRGSCQEMQRTGQTLVDSVLTTLPADGWQNWGNNPSMTVLTKTVRVPLEGWTEREINEFADKNLNAPDGFAEFGDTFLRAATLWRQTMLSIYQQSPQPFAEVPISFLFLGEGVFVGIGAEVFSHLATLVAEQGITPYILGMTNGTLGYIPVFSAYDTCGYETDWSFLFYNQPQLKRGALEQIAEEIKNVITKVKLTEPQSEDCEKEIRS
jgi:hypothetical protein